MAIVVVFLLYSAICLLAAFVSMHPNQFLHFFVFGFVSEFSWWISIWKTIQYLLYIGSLSLSFFPSVSLSLSLTIHSVERFSLWNVQGAHSPKHSQCPWTKTNDNDDDDDDDTENKQKSETNNMNLPSYSRLEWANRRSCSEWGAAKRRKKEALSDNRKAFIFES